MTRMVKFKADNIIDMERLDASYIAGGIVKWYSHFKEQSADETELSMMQPLYLRYVFKRKAYTKYFVTLSIPTREEIKQNEGFCAIQYK